MTKLKTLKELPNYDYDMYGGDIVEDKCETDWVRKIDLKQEAIKWIKADKSNYYSRQGKDETILWIKHFFNIKEKDLYNIGVDFANDILPK